jgi:prepilin-type processing-associated H-X9-DG protein
MEQRNAISKTGVLVILIVLFLLFALMYSALSKLKKLASKDVCATHLKGLGTAITVYANDYNDKFPQLPGKGPWSKGLGFDYYLEKPDFTAGGTEEYSSRTISASLYLLVREADVSPKSFVCTESGSKLGIKPFEGDNPKGQDVVELWDFGAEPHKHVSYCYHNPYGRYPANSSLSASFAVVSDMSPWFEKGDIVPPGKGEKPPQIINLNNESTWFLGNSLNHKNRDWPYNKGQNVLFADGHAKYEKQPNVGVKSDNIFTFWSISGRLSGQDIQGGGKPTSRSKENDAKSRDDSFLAI